MRKSGWNDDNSPVKGVILIIISWPAFNNNAIQGDDKKKAPKSPMAGIDRLRSEGFIMRKKGPMKKAPVAAGVEKQRGKDPVPASLDRLKSDGHVLREKKNVSIFFFSCD